MPKSRIVLLLLALSLLAGCGEIVVFGHTVREGRSEVKPVPQTATTEATTTTAKSAETPSVPSTPSAPARPGPSVPSVHVLRAVTLELTPQAAAQVADDSKFKADALLDAIEAELRSRNLLDEAANGTAEVSIEDFAVQPASNAVLFGYVLSNGSLNGELRIRDAAGNDVQRYRIQAKSRLSAPAEGESPNLLSPLYRRFAVLTGDSVAGEPSKSSAADQPPH